MSLAPLRFVRRLLYFYKPSSKLYAGLELDHSRARHLTVVGCQFIEFLMESGEVRGDLRLTQTHADTDPDTDPCFPHSWIVFVVAVD